MQAPDSTGGRQAKCPLCGALQIIPMVSQGDPSGAFPAAPSDPPSQAPLAPTPPAGAGQVAAQPPKPGNLAVDCFKAIAYGASNFRSIFILVLYAAGVFLVVRLLAILIGPLLIFHPIGLAILYLINMAISIIMSGLYFRFYLDAVISSLEGVDQAPDLPPFSIKDMFATGLKGLGIWLVYLFPLVTLPLLPLALLAWGYSDDNAPFDVSWALRAAAKRPGQLLILWPIMLLWIALMIVASVILFSLLAVITGSVAATGCFGLLMSLLIKLAGVVVISAVGVMFITVVFRCIGMLGRHNPVLTDMLPENLSPGKTAGVIIGGIIASVVMWWFVVGPLVGIPAPSLF